MKSASAYLLRCAPLHVVRIGMIGLGQRGLKTLQRYADIPGAEIRCLADLSQVCLDEANGQLALSGRHIARTFCGPEAWKELCQQNDIDLVYICTDWSWHATMAIEAMNCGKHVAVEVPLATTIEDCWRVVETAERTQRHCFMTENCCYDWFHLATLSLAETGALGTITHCEGAYIHDWRDLFDNASDASNTPSHSATTNSPTSSTSTTSSHPTTNPPEPSVKTVHGFYEQSCHHGGNPYPTHAIGPIAQILGFHRHDRMLRLVSMTGNAAGNDSLLGHGNSTLITTERGVTVLLQFDCTTPRPYSRLQTVCGTNGFVQKYPLAIVKTGEGLREGEHAEAFMKRHINTVGGRLWKEGKNLGVDNEMNYAMDRRLIECLQKGLPLDIDVYDGAEWSCLTELTRQSALAGGTPVEIPDFTIPRLQQE